ncbi:uncharacterized protein LOC124138962 [Haliotis rufescens]|uniref:uncharacterized protein LOC124138962 n=1 Tax=Haliotis rufescens TaxID=6454 RepID=UPI00201EC32E|nr:uncharacterized protein LOC124138962 [Haliotis rufescens]XP_046361856.2 uncharacterized protein LOC124138962 [Haliotis rufescens]
MLRLMFTRQCLAVAQLCKTQQTCTRALHATCAQRASRRHKTEGDEAIQFTGSKAASWNTQDSFGPPRRDMPWYQPISISLSLAVFLTYFMFIREENDVDIELNKSLFERVPGLEEQQVKMAIKHGQERGMDTTDLEMRMTEILDQKQMSKNL